VDGEQGRLIIRGYPVEELVERATFEDVYALMWEGATHESENAGRL
jgi:citrate synthase